MPRSESVWFEQVDRAFIHYIRSIVKLPDSRGVLHPVPVTVRKPDEDFKIESYPCITLYNLYSQRDEIRYCPEPVVVSRNMETKTIIEESNAIPYSLYYQLDFWSRQQSHMNEMTRLWLGHCPDKCFNLPVTDVSGIERDSFVLLTDGLKKSDELSGTERTFHSILTYRVWVELDERIAVEKPMIITIEPDVKRTN